MHRRSARPIVGRDPTCGQIGALGVGCSRAGIGPMQDSGSCLADVLGFWHISPNPAGSECATQFGFNRSCRASLSFYDVRGRQVGVAFDRAFAAGEHSYSLIAGVDRSKAHTGLVLRSGVYFAVLRVGEQVHTKKVILTE